MKARKRKPTQPLGLVKATMESLALMITDARCRYYRGLDSPFTDVEYDRMEKALGELEKGFPGLVDKHSPLGKVGHENG